MSDVGVTLRAAAATAIDAVVRHGQSLDAALSRAEAEVPQKEWPLLRMLCYGTLRNYFRIDEILETLLDKPLKKSDKVIHALLAVGLFQLTDSRIPDHAAVSQTVEAAKKLKRRKMAGLVNALLRRFGRDNMATLKPSSIEAVWNHPEWLINAIKRDWPDDLDAILQANNARAPMWLRVNSRATSVADYQQHLRRHLDPDISADTVAGLADALRLSAPLNPNELPGFMEGHASIQDGAAQLAARWLLDNPPSDLPGPLNVLDACAAPGGKTGHLKEIGGDTIQLTAVDNDAARTPRIAQNLERLHCHATIKVADASNPKTWWNGTPFDAILLDAPCSATGVIRRHPDIKFLRRPSDLKRLAQRQFKLLEALWALLRPGGRLLYVTCSVMAAENDDVVRAFIDAHQDAKENDVLPNNNIHALMRRKAYGYQILPGTARMDGFYFACLEKQTGSQQKGPEKVS